MTSKEIKAAFNASDIKVRVKALPRKGFRICTLDESPHGEKSQCVAASLGMTTSWGKLGGFINSPYEMFSYAPGAVRIVS